MKKILFLFCCALSVISVFPQQNLDSLLPVRGLAIAAPKPDGVERFVRFIDEELAPRNVNTLILRVDYNYQYTSHPELAESNALSKADVQSIVKVCKRHNIRIVPQINLLGHQSWAGTLGKLLEVYPEFDETPQVEMPENYEWPNEDGLYCKSYCPLHPEVHKVVFALVDEITKAFEADAFHAGMDEVFYIGNEKCPRCGGRDKAELYAGEVTRIRNHLAQTGKRLWIWGDRLIDGKSTGMGMWEASMNNTHRAIDLIPRDVMICDWHYERADPTAVYFAMKGFDVATCPWRKKEVAKKQLSQMTGYRANATPEMKKRFRGMIHTIWTDADSFLDLYYGKTKNKDKQGDQADCFKVLFDEINSLGEARAEPFD
ncbi:family 20 glycosylhydrolase [Sinomicrobium weinanense]|uniref:beta-N-acetylhexosaminidase n=1 Tax=Sinomicrobium weinanense TaxID=2842200 RepID=A0A926Q291_9FLAO|nr:family 20 glycosylhydrolase [Sinomicrobium weinanense]MBC9795609.1 family 20 glycosylhydrolase [Sinomicrobium weinanense]MBU3124630.1 family 20 glycosylhydrolase [Sinomicrobium weinanense]